MIAWGSTTFTSSLEDQAWRFSWFDVACGGLFTIAGISGLDMATKRKQADRRMDIIKGLVYGYTLPFLFYILLIRCSHPWISSKASYTMSQPLKLNIWLSIYFAHIP